MKLYELLNVPQEQKNKIKYFEENIVSEKNDFLSEWFKGFNLYEKFEDPIIENIIQPYKIYHDSKKYMCILHFVINTKGPTLTLESPTKPIDYKLKEESRYSHLFFNNKQEIKDLILQLKLTLSHNYIIDINVNTDQLNENIKSEKNEFLYVDNPGGEWLEYQRERAAKSRFGGGTLTANIGISKKVDIKVKYISGLNGVNGEEAFRSGGIKYWDLKKSIEENGWQPDPIMIWVDYLGIAKVAEGNHRIFMANKLGVEWIPGDIRYFAGGEEQPGKFYPPALFRLNVIRPRAPVPQPVIQFEQ